MICSEVFDEFSYPSNEEVVDYAIRIGIDPNNEPDLLFLAREGLMKPLPACWKPCFDIHTQSYYYHNMEMGTSQWTHPCDEHYQKLVLEERNKLTNKKPAVINQLSDNNTSSTSATETDTKECDKEKASVYRLSAEKEERSDVVNGDDDNDNNNDNDVEDDKSSVSFKLAADGAKFLKKSHSNTNLRSILRPCLEEHTDDGKKNVRFDLSMTNFVAIADRDQDYNHDRDRDHDHDYDHENDPAGDSDNVNISDENVEEEIDQILEKGKKKSQLSSFERLNEKLLSLSEAKNRLSVSPVSFDESELSNNNSKVRVRGRFSISPVSLNDDKEHLSKSKIENEQSPIDEKLKTDSCCDLDRQFAIKISELKSEKGTEFQNQPKLLQNQHNKRLEELQNKFKLKNLDEKLIENLIEEKEDWKRKYETLNVKYQKLKTKVKSSIENRRTKKALENLNLIANAEQDDHNVADVNSGVLSAENLRKQLKRLDDLEEQLPLIAYDDQVYKIQYPFSKDSRSSKAANLDSTADVAAAAAAAARHTDPKSNNFVNELSFFRHRIHLERDCIRRAKASLRTQQDTLQKEYQRQQCTQNQQQQNRHGTNEQPSTRNKQNELLNVELSLYRTRGLLGEKIIRLRHLEKCYADLLKSKNLNDLDESTLSDVSSCKSASSGFSSIELNEIASQSQSQSQSKSMNSNSSPTAKVAVEVQSPSQSLSQLHPPKASLTSVPNEVMRTLEKLNREIHDIWDVLISQQSKKSNRKSNLSQWFKPKFT